MRYGCLLQQRAPLFGSIAGPYPYSENQIMPERFCQAIFIFRKCPKRAAKQARPSGGSGTVGDVTAITASEAGDG
jgi:hypothetical protein